MLFSKIDPGNIRRYDMTRKVALPILRLNFENLSIDPYIEEGFRRKHITRYLVESKLPFQLRMLPQESLFQRKQFNPTHGDLHRFYPRLYPNQDTMRVIEEFVIQTAVKEGERILVQAQRVTCSPDMDGLPSVEDWHQDDVTEIGILCVTRHNIKGGENQFKLSQENTKDIFCKRMLEEGELLIFDDAPVQHRVTPIQIADSSLKIGFRDVLLLSHGGST